MHLPDAPNPAVPLPLGCDLWDPHPKPFVKYHISYDMGAGDDCCWADLNTRAPAMIAVIVDTGYVRNGISHHASHKLWA